MRPADGLTGNYVLYLVALSHTTPSVAQIVIQLALVFLLLGGLIVFRERFSARPRGGGLVAGGACAVATLRE